MVKIEDAYACYLLPLSFYFGLADRIRVVGKKRGRCVAR